MESAENGELFNQLISLSDLSQGLSYLPQELLHPDIQTSERRSSCPAVTSRLRKSACSFQMQVSQLKASGSPTSRNI